MNAGDVEGRPLTERQVEILRQVADGLTIAAAGRQLRMSVNTAKSHLAGARTRLGASNNAHAVAIAFRQGVLR